VCDAAARRAGLVWSPLHASGGSAVRLVVSLICSTMGLSACSSTSELDPVERGRKTYVANCAACHHPNPAVDGSLGPAIAGSSRELLEARVVRGEYPPGYSPKQDSGLMQPMPYLAGEIDALAAYLATAAEPGDDLEAQPPSVSR